MFLSAIHKYNILHKNYVDESKAFSPFQITVLKMNPLAQYEVQGHSNLTVLLVLFASYLPPLEAHPLTLLAHKEAEISSSEVE
jgi:hypothetical protein